MKIKITKSSKDDFWYKDYIGKTYNIVGIDNEIGIYMVERPEINSKGLVSFDDCEILK